MPRLSPELPSSDPHMRRNLQQTTEVMLVAAVAALIIGATIIATSAESIRIEASDSKSNLQCSKNQSVTNPDDDGGKVFV